MKLGPWNDPNLRWVCENHPTKDAEHRLWFGFGPECGGAGMPDPESKWARSVSICCGVERSEIYPRDCWRCGALFVSKEIINGNL